MKVLSVNVAIGACLALGWSAFAHASDVIFETDFSQDSGYSVRAVGLWNGGGGSVSPPSGWDGVLASSNSAISVVQGAGVNGGNALRLEWDPNASQPTVSLGKHLTGNTATGYDELFIRYRVKMPDQFKAGSDATYLPYWKWGRLWQNTSPTGAPRANNWSENRSNSGYVVWGFGGGIPYTYAYSTWSENQGANLNQGSAGGQRQGVGYFVSGSDRNTQDGYFESMGDGEWGFDPVRPGYLLGSPQRYHTIEYRFKLASADGADDAVFEMWWDGVKQSKWTRIVPGSGAPQRTGIPTANRGSGFNFLTFFDNMAGWNADFGRSDVDGYLLVNDVVVSTSRIGDSYVAGNGGSPTPPVGECKVAH